MTDEAVYLKRPSVLGRRHIQKKGRKEGRKKERERERERKKEKTPQTVENQPPGQHRHIDHPCWAPDESSPVSRLKSFFFYLLGSILGKIYTGKMGQRQATPIQGLIRLMKLNIPHV